MTKAFENMLYLLGAGARGYEIDASSMDMAEVRKCAIAQGVWPIVYKAAEKTADVSVWRNEFIFTVAKSLTRRDFTLSIIRKLENAGIECCLMKGPSVAVLYAAPDCRISSDIDIYIDARFKNKAIKLLIENGYVIKRNEKHEHHVQAVHPIGGLLEVHVKVYSTTTEKIIFGGHISYSKDYDKIIIDGNEYKVMNVYDQLVYLTAHYIKHLVNNGCGIRQIADLLLYIEKNQDRIDFDKYDALMKKLRYDKLLEVIKTIGGKYFDYDYSVGYDDLTDKILTDTENGGSFGFMADDRKEFYNIYCARRNKGSKLGHILYMSFNGEKTIFDRLFPKKEFLIGSGYGYAKNTIMIPIAWIHRLFNVVLRRKKNYSGNKSAQARSMKRLEMMKELDMID